MHLFVYGTLRRAAAHPAHALLQPATFLGCARFQGWLFDLGGYPAAVASDDPAAVVVGEVYELHTPAASLAALDRYEGCTSSQRDPHEYRRQAAEVYLEAAQPTSVPVQIYLYNRPVDHLTRIPQGDYLAWLIRRSPARGDGPETRTLPAGSRAASD